MNAARRVARAGRNLLIALVVGAVILVAIVVAYMAGRTTAEPVAAPPTSQRPLQPSSSSLDEADVPPTGCLGGAGHDNAMLLGAQTYAPHTTYGAVEMAAAFFRWAYRSPFPTSAQARAASAAVVAPGASSRFKDFASSYAKASDITGGQVPSGTPFNLSTVTGVWRIVAGSTTDRVTVELSAPVAINGELSATKSAAMATTIVWNGGRWRVLSQQAPDIDALSAGGTQFTAGC